MAAPRRKTSVPVQQLDDKMEEFMFRKFGILPFIGGVYGYFKTPKWTAISYMMYAFMYTSVILTTLDLLYSSYLLRGNTSMFTALFHVFLVGCVVLTASCTLTYQRRLIDRWVMSFSDNNNVCEYQHYDGYFEELVRKSDLRLQNLMRMFLTGYGVSAVVGLSLPYVDMYLGTDKSLTNVSGIYWKGLPLAMWWPYNAHESLAAWVSSFMCQGVFAFFAPNMVTAAIMLCFYACECILNHMRLLIYSIEQLDQRARAMFDDRHPGMLFCEYGKEYESCYYECIIQNVKHHHTILKGKEEFLEMANYAIAVPFFGGAMLLGLAGLNLLSDGDPRLGPKILVVCLAMTEAANMFLLCMYGEALQELSEELFNSVFYAGWYRRTMKCRRALMILRWGATRPMTLNAAKLIVLNMETFSNLVNSAYSIFNLSAAGD